MLPAAGNPLPQLMALAPWRRMGDEVILLGADADSEAPWAPLVDQMLPEDALAAGRLAWGRVVVRLPGGARWPEGLRDGVLAAGEIASWGFCNRWPAPVWLSRLDPRRPNSRYLDDRALFWQTAVAARIHQPADLLSLGAPARLPLRVARRQRQA